MISAKQPKTIAQMFDQISTRYDFVNAVLSFGMHVYWKKKLIAVGLNGLNSDCRILDCATGTGDIAVLWKRAFPLDSEVIGIDFSPQMIKCAKQKHLNSGILFSEGDVQSIAHDTDYFDCASISFGIRNVADPVQALRELARVVKPGGRVIILEFGQPHVPFFSFIFRFYSRFILPKLGGLLSGERAAYEYLNDSSARFPCGENFLALVQESDSFSAMSASPMSGGIVWLYVLVK